MRKQPKAAAKPAENSDAKELAQLRREVDELQKHMRDVDRSKRAAIATRSQADNAIKAMARLLAHADAELRVLRGNDLDDEIPF